MVKLFLIILILQILCVLASLKLKGFMYLSSFLGLSVFLVSFYFLVDKPNLVISDKDRIIVIIMGLLILLLPRFIKEKK